MFDQFFIGLQQDIKLALWAPLLSAIGRAVFICVYGPKYSLMQDWKKLYHSFRYGFWWGMDFHAYVFLISMIIVSLPAAFSSLYFAMSDSIRLALLGVYATVLYVAFMGKMIFYYHFHDIYNPTLRLGGHADKRNLLDIFFNENHGIWILIGYIPYILGLLYMAEDVLSLGTYSLPLMSSDGWAYARNILIVVLAILGFYFFRFGGTLKHRNKPEWDEVPAIVKEDMFLAKATVDDLVALEMIYKQDLQSVLGHDDETARCNLSALPELEHFTGNNPLDAFHRLAGGAKISKPQHIFFLVGESYTQSAIDSVYIPYHMGDRGRDFQELEHSICMENFLPSGLVSQPAITSLISGIYDCNLEINEKKLFWEHSIQTSLPFQLKQLGYRTELWYGGGLSWASLGHFAKAMGFDTCYSGFDICGTDVPKTWLGVYDHLFLQEVFNRISSGLTKSKGSELINGLERTSQLEDSSEPTFHFIYTTSNHRPTTIPIEEYGWNPKSISGSIPDYIYRDESKMADIGTYWYAEKALFDFVDAIKEAYPDSLIIVTGDHSYGIVNQLVPFVGQSSEAFVASKVEDCRSQTLRERWCTYFSMYHPDIEPSWVDKQGIGNHMQIMPTLFELIAPKGWDYYSIMPSLFEPQECVVTPYHWMTRDTIGYFGESIAQDLYWRDAIASQTYRPIQTAQDNHQFEDIRDAYMELTGWMIRHPELLIRK